MATRDGSAPEVRKFPISVSKSVPSARQQFDYVQRFSRLNEVRQETRGERELGRKAI